MSETQVQDVMPQQQTVVIQSPEGSAVDTNAGSTTSVASVKTVKHSKKVTSTKTSTVKSVKSSSTTTSSSSSQSKTTTTASSTSSSATFSATASKSVAIQKSGQTYSQHIDSITSGEGKDQLALDLDSAKKLLAGTDQNARIHNLVLVTQDNQDSTVRLNPEDLMAQKDGGKAAILSFNISEFESQSVEVRTDGNKIQVHAKKKHVNTDGEERSEEFSRIYELPSPEPIDPAKVNTSIFQDGVLTIELPVSTEIVVTIGQEENMEEQKEG